MSTVSNVEQEEVEAALAALDEIDVDAANVLRQRIRAYCLFDVEMLEMRELLLRLEYRLTQLSKRTHELAIAFERVARDADI